MSDQRRALEEERIRSVYAARAASDADARYELWRPAALRIRASQLDHLACALGDEGLVPLEARRILEIGCGTGQWLVDLETMGARREHLAGIDLDEARLAVAARRLGAAGATPGADIRRGSAADLPWASSSFDVVLQSTVLTSVLDPDLRASIAAEMARVLRPEGCVVWYDFRYDNPWNHDVRGLGRREIERLFPGWRARYRSVTLAPPLGRRVASFSATLALALEQLRVFNTHFLVTLRPE